jgi:hypothetical protein
MCAKIMFNTQYPNKNCNFFHDEYNQIIQNTIFMVLFCFIYFPTFAKNIKD